MAWSLLVPILWSLSFGVVIQAVQIEVRGPRFVNASRELVSRAPGGLTLNNSGDLSYYADILLGNQSFKVLVDTGSSDLWVAGTVVNSIDTGHVSGVKYAAGSVLGPIKQATLEFAGHQVTNQAFYFLSILRSRNLYSIQGLGPSSGSFISKQLSSTTGVPVLDRIFMQNRTTPNYFTILLGRNKDPTDFFSGKITVGEVLEDFPAVLEETRMPMTKVIDSESEDQHLQILLDADGIIGPDGKSIPFHSVVGQTVNKKQATVVLDCGFTLPQMSRSVVDAIYSRFHGSEYLQVPGIGGAWILPCEQEVNITFKFAGQSYPVHPLDMSMNSKGEAVCIGTFQPFTYDRGINPNYDMVLGMAFMRNVYTLFDYGDYIDNSPDLMDPYIQMLSITNMTEAHQDFVTVRLNGVDTTGTRGLKDPSASSKPRTTMYYIVAAVAVVAILFAVAIFFILRARRRRSRR
ncbi:aspartic peptidase domain-containing protein [Crassisporium funariophilum]|nr:aspartic peptidase domain-containing protein [Crassisporium funariophilum]